MDGPVPKMWSQTLPGTHPRPHILGILPVYGFILHVRRLIGLTVNICRMDSSLVVRVDTEAPRGSVSTIVFGKSMLHINLLTISYELPVNLVWGRPQTKFTGSCPQNKLLRWFSVYSMVVLDSQISFNFCCNFATHNGQFAYCWRCDPPKSSVWDLKNFLVISEHLVDCTGTAWWETSLLKGGSWRWGATKISSSLHNMSEFDGFRKQPR
jgi:hypothetical protein